MAAMIGGMREVTDATFADEVLAAEQPVVVDFWAPWCGPCKAIEPALEELPLDVVKLDIDANPSTAARYGVLSLPTVILFAGGEPRETVHGARPKKHFEKAFAATSDLVRQLRSAPSRRARTARRCSSSSTPSPSSTRPIAAKPARLRHGREQLEVLAETEVVDGRPVCERNALELDDAAHARAARDVAEVDREPVRDVHLRVRAARELASLVDPQRRPDVAAVAERGAGRAERAGDDERVAGLRRRRGPGRARSARAR